MSKTIEKIYKIKKAIKNAINLGVPLVFKESPHFLNGSLENLVKNSRRKDFYFLP